MKGRRQESAAPGEPPPEGPRVPPAGGTPRTLGVVLAQALTLHQLLDAASMHETDEVRLLLEGVIAGLRAATGSI